MVAFPRGRQWHEPACESIPNGVITQRADVSESSATRHFSNDTHPLSLSSVHLSLSALVYVSVCYTPPPSLFVFIFVSVAVCLIFPCLSLCVSLCLFHFPHLSHSLSLSSLHCLFLFDIAPSLAVCLIPLFLSIPLHSFCLFGSVCLPHSPPPTLSGMSVSVSVGLCHFALTSSHRFCLHSLFLCLSVSLSPFSIPHSLCLHSFCVCLSVSPSLCLFLPLSVFLSPSVCLTLNSYTPLSLSPSWPNTPAWNLCTLHH